MGERFVRNEEVSGSIPLISTNMRGLPPGSPSLLRRSDRLSERTCRAAWWARPGVTPEH